MLNSFDQVSPSTSFQVLPIAEMPQIRIFYHKLGRAKYISHLDLMRFMQRAFKRTGIPVWYTQGFHPHMYLTFALPLPLGYESECETMDVRLHTSMDMEEIKQRLNTTLPMGLQVQRVALQQYKPQDICYAKYEMTLIADQIEEVMKAWNQFYEQPEIIVFKRTKKGQKKIDVKAAIQVLSQKEGATHGTYELLCAAGAYHANPSLLTDEFLKQYQGDHLRIQFLRKQLLLNHHGCFY